MKKREWALIGAFVLALVYLQQTVVETAFVYYMEQQAEALVAPTPAPHHGPDIRHCMGEDRDLWDCIRHAD